MVKEGGSRGVSMLRVTRSKLRAVGSSGFPVLALCAAAAVLSACSADISRFDSPLYRSSRSDGPGSAWPTPPDSVRRNAGGPVFRDEAPGYVPSVAETQDRRDDVAV